MMIYRLVLTNGVVISAGDAWPGPDGKPLTIKVKGVDHPVQIPGIVYQILFVPDTIHNVEDDDGNPIVETTPSHYKIFMCSNEKDGGGLLNDAGIEETQAYTIYTQQVLMVGHVYKMREALEEIKELIEIQLEKSGGVPNENGQAQQTQAAAGS